MHKKKGFTLIELMLVMAILWIMAWMGSWYLSSLDADRVYTESCTNAVFSDLADWVYYASTSRIISWDIVPDYYVIDMSWDVYNLNYWSWKLTNTSTWILYLPRTVNDFMYCKQSKNYYNRLSANFKDIKMLPGLVPDWDKSGFKICKDSDCWSNLLATWAITIEFCPKSDVLSACVEYGQIYFDARVAVVRKRLCKKYKKNAPTKCEERTTWR